jgi:Ser/Thr protein kinase RdoA (MazF antagonist)
MPTIGPYQCDRATFTRILQQFPPLHTFGMNTPITGPFDGKINSIYRIDLTPENALIFRTRISKAFRYEPIVKEKILYPFLDRTLTCDTPHLEKKIDAIINSRQGTYIFQSDRPSITPVQDLLYYYEPEAAVPPVTGNPEEILPPRKFPFLVTIKNYLPGQSLFDILKTLPPNEHNSAAILTTMELIGRVLGDLHSIRFDGFYDQITDIAHPKKRLLWKELFAAQWKKNLTDAAQYPAFKPLIPAVDRFYREFGPSVEQDEEAVLFHNDFQAQNLLFRFHDNLPWSDTKKLEFTGVIDFDNWRIGPRAQDFVKMEYWTIQDHQPWLDAFYRGYHSRFPVTKELKARIVIYKILWFMLVYAFEMDKIRKAEQNITVDSRFPAADKYLQDIEKNLETIG